MGRYPDDCIIFGHDFRIFGNGLCRYPFWSDRMDPDICTALFCTSDGYLRNFNLEMQYEMAGDIRPSNQHDGGNDFCGSHYSADWGLNGMKKSYEEMSHVYGRIWILCALGMIFAYPIVTCIYYGAWPGW